MAFFHVCLCLQGSLLACLELVCQYSQLAEAARQAVVVHLAPAMAGAVARRSEQQDAGFLCLKLLCDLVTYAASRLDGQVGQFASGCLDVKCYKESLLAAAVDGQVGQHVATTMERCGWQLLCACAARRLDEQVGQVAHLRLSTWPKSCTPCWQLLRDCAVLGMHGKAGQLACLRLPRH